MANEIYRYYDIPDVRDGLTELERTILYALYDARKEYGDRHIPTVLIWGRVVERLDVSHEAFMRSLQRVLNDRLGEAMDPSPNGPDPTTRLERPSRERRTTRQRGASFRKKPDLPEQGSLF